MTDAPDDDFDRALRGRSAAVIADTVPYEEPTGSRLDDWWQAQLARPGFQRGFAWGGPIAVTVLASVLRLWDLGTPHELVFDETYYVKDSWTLMHLGYEGSWPSDANTAFNAGDPNTYNTSPSFIAHPPVGKWVIAAGLALFGGSDPIGWRISVAVAGILLVVVTMLIAKGLFNSPVLTTVAGLLIAIDGNAIVMSRVALLDTILALFALLGVGAVLLDRRWATRRLDLWLDRREALGRSTHWGPSLWWRPWLLAAGVAFGLAAGVKWSGVYFLAIWAVYSVLSEIFLRRRAGIGFWASSAILKQGPVTFLLTVPIAAVAYVASWLGWFLTDGGYYHNWAQATNGAWTGPFAWVPLKIQNWVHYQSAM